MDSTPGDSFPSQIKQLRSRLGLTQAMLAERLGVSFPTVNRWENRKSVPSQLSWNRLLEISGERQRGGETATAAAETPEPPLLDFTARPAAVSALVVELGLRRIRYERQVEVDVNYKGHIIKGQRVDILVEARSSSSASRS